MTDKTYNQYAEYYDLIYKDKEYGMECDFIDGIFKSTTSLPIKTVLECGCGTGGHAILLAKKGYDVFGIDLSEQMIIKAREKSKGIKNLTFDVMNMTDFKIDKKFDACISMFAAIGEVTKNKELQDTFLNIHDHLKEHGLFVFDVWNGLAVLRQLPEVRFKTVDDGRLKIIRMAEPTLDAFTHTCKVTYTIFILKEKNIIDELIETTIVRYFFPQEIKKYLEDANFDVLKICPFMDLNGKVDENTWRMTIIAKAI